MGSISKSRKGSDEKGKDKDKVDLPSNSKKVANYFEKNIQFGINAGGGRTQILRVHIPISVPRETFLTFLMTAGFTEVNDCTTHMLQLEVKCDQSKIDGARNRITEFVDESLGAVPQQHKQYVDQIKKSVTHSTCNTIRLGFQFAFSGGRIRYVYIIPNRSNIVPILYPKNTEEAEASDERF